MTTPLATRPLGSTGERVSLLGLGGFHLGLADGAAEAVRIVRTALDAGLTFLDNCWDYHDGESERRVGLALRDGWRARAFVMTKIDGRDRRTAARQIDESLARLGVDAVDLMQIHEVIRPEDPERCFAPDGAIEALLRAREAGKVRRIGFTGHKSPRWHLAMLRAAEAHGFAFDAVQLPLNVLDVHHDSFAGTVLPVLAAKGIAALGMKPLAEGRLVARGIATAEECLRFALSLPVSVVITGCESLARLEQALRIARGFAPLSAEEQDQLLARTAGAGRGGVHELYKTTEAYDGTSQHPAWLGGDLTPA